jgi:dGTPase
MALGHDIGHTPFGHTGEDILDKLYPDGFLHNLQSIRVVEILENDGAGLNLTQEVKDGILKHSVSREKITGMPNSLEGEICKIADKIAYINHDIDDAFRARLIKEADLPKSSVQLLGSSYSERVNSFVVNVIQESQKSINKSLDGISAPDNKKATISLTPAFLQEMKTLKKFLYERAYSSVASTEREEARTIICSLYEYFSKNPSKIPEKFLKIAKNKKERAIVDYIAGMTDNYALNKHTEIKKI